MATIYKAHGEVINSEPKNGNDYQLEELNAIVSGYIEIVSLHDGRIMVINEEGKIHGLAINWKATEIFQSVYGASDIIVGDVLVCDENQVL